MKIKGQEKPDILSRRLEQQGYTSWVTLRSGDVFAKIHKQGDLNTYEVPELVRDKKPRIVIEVSETGGNGFATIVAGGSGKKLRPYRQLWETKNPSEDHACFSVHGSVVLVNYTEGVVSIVKYEVFASDTRLGQDPLDSSVEQVVLKEEEKWRGQPDELPSKFGGFREAVDAVVRKACSKTLGVFFAIPPKIAKQETHNHPTTSDDPKE